MKYLPYVNVKMGTQSTDKLSCGNTNPITSIPFGMNHFFLQTRNDNQWPFYPHDARTGGLRLAHIASPWLGDYSKMVFYPATGDGNDATRTDGSQECAYNVKNFVMTPAYIYAELMRYGIKMEFAPTLRSGIIRATWDELASKVGKDGDTRRITVFVDGKNNQFNIDETGKITGYTDNSRFWRTEHIPENFKMYFAISFDRRINKEKTIISEKGISIAFEGEPSVINCRFATSFVSIEQAETNFKNEVVDKTLEDVRELCEQEWESYLGRIEIDASDDIMRTFYSCFYRTFLFPRTFHEIASDGSIIHYSPANGKICDGIMYTDNGFWDTYRTVYPIFSIIAREKYREICEGLVNFYKEGGWLPRWMSPSALDCMPGTAIDAVFGDAAEKGVVTDEKLLCEMLEALLKHIDNPPASPALGRDGWESFKKLGYVTSNYVESVNKTQDYSYGNFCASKVAKAIGKTEIAERLMATAQNYQKLFDAETGFLRAKDENGNMRTDFTEFDWGGDYTEGGPWQNSLAMYHDFGGYAKLLGGKDVLLKRVERLFATYPYFRIYGYDKEIHEMTEMAICAEFGQCALCNQPSFHLPYMFSCLGDRDQSAYWVKKCVRELFKAEPEGFPGDEDNGTMASWYVFSALGFYPVCPGCAEYVIAAPSVKHAVIHLENGKAFEINAPKNNADKSYASKIKLNKALLKRTVIDHESIMMGGQLVFNMSTKPSGQKYTDKQLPYSITR